MSQTIFVAWVFFLLATGPVSPLGYADDAINLVAFKRALRHDEREIYERASSTDVVARQKQYKFVLQYDRIAFQRSYPQLASVFESPELTQLINDNFFPPLFPRSAEDFGPQ